MNKKINKRYIYAMALAILSAMVMLGCAQNEEPVVETKPQAESVTVGEKDVEDIVTEPSETVESETEEDSRISEEETGHEAEMNCEEETSDDAISEDSEEVSVEDVEELYIDEQKLISEKDALEIAYNYYYGDSEFKEYSVYCEELPCLMEEDMPYLQKLLGRSYAQTSKSGYVVYQCADKSGIIWEKFDSANPSPEKDKWILYSLGSTDNQAYYVFWLYQYVSEGDGFYHLTTGDYCIVYYDGSMVVSERKDSEGNDINDPELWNDLETYLN